jgi:hypothetical protein
MLACARADGVGTVIWNHGVRNPGQRSLTHSPWAIIVRPYRTFSVCCAEVWLIRVFSLFIFAIFERT